MTIDDLVKLLLALGLTFAIVGISFQIMRILAKLADSLQDFRKVWQNVGTISDLAVEDYGEIRKTLRSVLGFVEKLQTNILQPFQSIFAFLGKLLSFLDRGNYNTRPAKRTKGSD